MKAALMDEQRGARAALPVRSVVADTLELCNHHVWLGNSLLSHSIGGVVCMGHRMKGFRTYNN